jgi:all-trans-nonaprenyl-diphosphate synthase
LIEREFHEPGDIEEAIALIRNSQGIERSQELAAKHAGAAVQHLADLSPSESRQALIQLTEYILKQLH